jgi:hypothetical protein
VQQHAASFIAHTEASVGTEPPRSIKEEFDAFLEPELVTLVLQVVQRVVTRHHLDAAGLVRARSQAACCPSCSRHGEHLPSSHAALEAGLPDGTRHVESVDGDDGAGKTRRA